MLQGVDTKFCCLIWLKFDVDRVFVPDVIKGASLRVVQYCYFEKFKNDTT